MPSSPMPRCPLLPQVPAPQPWIRCLETKDLVPDWPGDVGHLTCYYRACLLICKMRSGQKSPPMGLVCTSVSSQSDRQTDRQAGTYTHTLTPTDSHTVSHTPLRTRECTRFHIHLRCAWPLACFGCSCCPIFYFSFSDNDPSPRRPVSFLIPIAPPPLHLSFIMSPLLRSPAGQRQEGRVWDVRGELQWARHLTLRGPLPPPLRSLGSC